MTNRSEWNKQRPFTRVNRQWIEFSKELWPVSLWGQKAFVTLLWVSSSLVKPQRLSICLSTILFSMNGEECICTNDRELKNWEIFEIRNEKVGAKNKNFLLSASHCLYAEQTFSIQKQSSQHYFGTYCELQSLSTSCNINLHSHPAKLSLIHCRGAHRGLYENCLHNNRTFPFPPLSLRNKSEGKSFRINSPLSSQPRISKARRGQDGDGWMQKFINFFDLLVHFFS